MLRDILTAFGSALRKQGGIEERGSFINAAFEGIEIAKTKRGNGMKIIEIVNRNKPAIAAAN